jgi:hypothetical protein
MSTTGSMAFLNNSHEANIAVYTPAEEMKRADILNRTREIEARLQERTPEWQSRMASWEERVRGDQPEWTVLRPEIDDISTGGQKYLPYQDGLVPRTGLCADQAPRQDDG